MASQHQSIVVEQTHNPHFNSSLTEHDENNPRYKYHVVKTVNTLVENISNYITPSRVQYLIDRGVTITIQPVK